jgi:flagellar motor switch protein FliM
MMTEASTGNTILSNGPQRLLEAAGVSIDRMPMLHVIFDRMASQCSESVRPFSTAPVLFSVTSIGSERIDAILERYENKVIVAIFYVQAWDARILIGLDYDFVFTLMDAFLGSDGSEPPYSDARGLSNMEVRLAQTLFDLFSNACRASFAAISDVTFKFERIETRLDFAVIAPRNSFGIITRLKLRALGRSGELFVVIPQAALNSIRQNLGRDLFNDSAVRDPHWTRQIKGEISRTEVEVVGLIEERHFILADIAELKVGQVFTLQATTKSRVRLECNGEPLYWCQLGQDEGHYTLRVDDFIDQEQEFIDDVLSP